MTIKKRAFHVFIFIWMASMLFVLTACQENEKEFHILIFSNLPQEAVLKGGNMVEKLAVEGREVQFHLYPPLLERLVVEIVNHSGDIILLDRSMLPAILDPVGLHPLNELNRQIDAPDEFDLYASDENGNMQLFALPVSNDHPIFQDVPLTSDLVAIIPRYTNNKEQAFDIMKEWIK